MLFLKYNIHSEKWKEKDLPGGKEHTCQCKKKSEKCTAQGVT